MTPQNSDDLQSLLKEGRFWSQIQKMVDWKKSFMTLEIPCEVYYIIEGEADTGLTDHRPAIGKSKTPSLTQVKVSHPIKSYLDSTQNKGQQFLNSKQVELITFFQEAFEISG